MIEDLAPENVDADMQVEQQSAADSIGQYVSGIAQAAVSDRAWIEDRWLDDMRQLRGLPRDGETGQRHRHNITKSKTLTAEARISDMLFQQGDKNFSVMPAPDTPPEQKQQQTKAATELEKEIHAQLSDSDYESVGRKVIKYACELGVGILKGPVKSVILDKSWQQLPIPEGGVVNCLQVTQSTVPETQVVAAWDYFPDLSAADQHDTGYEFQRHYMAKSDLQKLLMRDDFNSQEILDIINTETPADPPRHLVELRDTSLPQAKTDHFVIWEGSIKIPKSMVNDLCSCDPDREGNFFEENNSDENFDVECVAWVSDSGKLLKFCPNPLETDERPFSVFCLDRDTSCYMASPGVPRQMRESAKTVNSAWQRINDNSDLSVGPQFIADPSVVEPIPVKGKSSWNMTANKGWRLKRPGADARQAFHFFNVPSGVQENMLILNQALQFADVETMLPQIAQGESSSQMTKTFQGMELLMNAASTISRRIIKDWDDNITVPLIGRYLDDNLQNNPIAGVFGKFIPNAEGTSSLLLKETQAKNAMGFSQVVASNPEFAKRTNWDNLYQRIARGFQFDPDVVGLSSEELQQKAQQPPPPNPDMLKVQLEQQKIQSDQQFKQAKLQADTQLKQAELQQDAQQHTEDNQLKQRELDAKIKIEELKLNVGMQKEFDGHQVSVAKQQMQDKSNKEDIVLNSRAKESQMSTEVLLQARTGEKI